jgi:hypothetical protein
MIRVDVRIRLNKLPDVYRSSLMITCLISSFKILVKKGTTKANSKAASKFYNERINEAYNIPTATNNILQRRMDF